VTVGSGTWVLRSASSAELLEARFTGVYASFTYHADK
jgi:hypothetical protein